MQYEFPHIRLLRGVRLEVENRGGRLEVQARGFLGPLFRWLLSRFLDIYNSIGPVGASDGANVYSLYVPPVPSRAHARHTEAFFRRWLFGTRIPLAVTIGVTGRCQCRCVHCSAVDSGGQASPLSLDEVRRVVAESVALGVTNVTFTGGEPLLREDLEALVATVPAREAVSLVFTNGIGLTPGRTRQLKDAGLWGVQVSLDSPEEDAHDRLRGWSGCFEAVRAGVAASRAAGLFVGLSTYATSEFVRDGTLARIAELGASWGAHELTVFDALPSGRLRDREALLLSSGSRRRLVKDGLDLRAKYRGRMHVVTQSWTNSAKGFARFIGCLAGHYQFHVTADGSFRPCDFTPLSIGNVRASSVPELWQSLISHPAYRRHSHSCRMQCPDFRKRFLDESPRPASS